MRAILLTSIFLAGCSSCSQKNNSSDAGTGDTGTDSDTDVDTDSDTETYSTDAGPWDWQDIPSEGDCGPGCDQLTFTHSVRQGEWDVWDNLLACSSLTEEGTRIILIDVEEKKYLVIPDVYPEHPITAMENGAFHPAVYQEEVRYILAYESGSGLRQEMISVDLGAKTQTVIWGRDEPGTQEWGALVNSVDSYGSKTVSRAGCGDPQTYSLCLYEEPWPSSGDVLIADSYGLGNSLWGDVVVFMDVRELPEDITGYRFSTQQFFNVADENDGDEHQSLPRIYGSTVAYMDFRYGSGTPTGSWEHAAVFVKDIEGESVVEVTDGSAIAAFPDINDDVVVWLDWRHCSDPQDVGDSTCAEVYGYNLTSQNVVRVTDLPGRLKERPRIWGERAFLDMQKLSGYNALYMFSLPDGLK